uniref:Uncharacterized protein n=1 Tax=Chromera velia CCMP2878 TaxID=1169474 RepID=A0A0G4FGT1_9ALVE|eukprot:Cvel_3316.t1-p1 / transcript=Cvel_3316.t1 / gene=Cvel_3316 / organism=Chromera_velia_CCMP2878 / gene_product=hypothetical protein / transcript_product=hypothetical protein / location=Cvel_scaffold131:115676-118930(+) / protein_length=346 / sequence_SO=supercontig / SO=protein_coding / is_pseudo=false
MKAARGESAQTLLFSSTSSWSSLKASKREREGREERSSVSPGRLKGEGQTKKRGERQGKPLKAKRREIILVNPTEFRFCALSYDLPSFVELKPFPFRWRLSIPETSFQGLLLEELRLPFRWSCYPSVFGFNEAMKVLRGKGKPNGAAGEELSDPRENNVGKNSNFSVADKVFSNLSTVSSFFSRAFSFFLPLEKKKRRPQDGTPSSLHQTDQPVSPEKPSPSPSLDCSFEISISKLSLPSLSSSSGSGSGFGGGVRCNLEVRDQGGKGKGKGLPNREWNVKRQNGSSRKRGGPRSVYDPPDCASIAEPLRCRLETGEGTQSDNPQAFTFVYFDTNRKKGAWKWLNL